jgi:hypothetical protein
MITQEALYGIIASVVLYGLYHFLKALQSAVVQIRRIAKVAHFLYSNRASLASISTELAETLKGANKINQDAVDANIALIKEVSKFRESVDRFVSTLAPPAQPESQPVNYDLYAMQNNYESNYNDLLEQGLDPEEAKIRAAAYELDYMAANGINTNTAISS